MDSSDQGPPEPSARSEDITYSGYPRQTVANPSSYRVFLTIWFGQLISTLGSGLTNFGIGVYILQHSAHDGTTHFALSALFSTLPGVLFGPIAGSLVDRWDRRKAMIVSAVGSGCASL